MLETMEQRTEGMKKQAQELIEQAYDMGYKKAEEDYHIQSEKDRESSYQLGIEVGRNEAWEAARRIISSKWCISDARLIKTFGKGHTIDDIMLLNSASEAIAKIKAYEEQKKHEEDAEIRVGDEVILNTNSSYEPNTKAIVIANDNSERYPYNVMVDNGDTECVDRDTIDRKTGRTFPEIVEVLKKLKEGE